MKNNIIATWISWHFYEAPKFILKVWNNYLQFSINYFSTPLLLKTLFAPWRKYSWVYPRGFDIGKYFEIFVSNIIARVIGFICRVFLILAGFVCQLVIALAGVVIFLGWLGLPLVLLAFLLFSIGII